MNCSDFDKRAAHVLLGQESDAVTARWNAHRAACAACAASAERVGDLLHGIRTADAPATSARFRAQLRSRLEFVRADERAGRQHELERAGSRWAWLRRRMFSSNVLNFALAAAAIVLIVLYTRAWDFHFDATQPAHDVAVAPPVVGTPAPAAPTDTTAESGALDPTGTVALDPAHPDRGAGVPDAHDGSDRGAANSTDAERDRLLEEALAGAPDAPPDILQRTRGVSGGGSGYATVRDLLRHRLPGDAAAGAAPSIVGAVTSHAGRWLLEQQQDDGSFEPALAGGRGETRVGATALALLALESAPGIPAGVIAQRVARGVAWLRGTQDKNGTFGEVAASESMTLFNHAAATLLLADRYAKDPKDGRAHEQQLADAVLRLDDLDRQRGARTFVDGDVVAGRFAALALEAARAARVPTVLNLDRVVARARAEHEGMVDPSWFRRGEFPPADQIQAAVTAGAIEPWDASPAVMRAKSLPVPTALDVLERPELREASLLFCTTLDLRTRGSSGWETYRQRLTNTLVKTQLRNGAFRADYTFDAVGSSGGMLYDTALAVLTLRVPER